VIKHAIHTVNQPHQTYFATLDKLVSADNQPKLFSPYNVDKKTYNSLILETFGVF
jgi:hypothetical protein